MFTGIGEFHNVFNFHAYSVNKKVVLDDHKACPTYQQLMYAKLILEMEFLLKKQVNEIADH